MTSKASVLFDCDHCEGNVVITTGPGRRHEFRAGITLEVPQDVPLAICQSCGRYYLTTDEAELLERHYQMVTGESPW